MKKLVVALALVLTTVTAACGSDDTPAPTGSSSGTPTGYSGTPAPTDSGTGKVNAVTVKSNEFVPASLQIKVGDEVTWTWAGGNHNVVSGAGCMPDGKFTSGNPTGTVGTTFKRKFDTAGTFEVYCDPHCAGGMKGSIVVQ